MVPEAGTCRRSPRAGSDRRTRRRFREIALDVIGSARPGTSFDQDRNALFFAGSGGDLRSESCRDARSSRGYCAAVEKQFAFCPMGIAGDVVAGVETWL